MNGGSWFKMISSEFNEIFYQKHANLTKFYKGCFPSNKIPKIDLYKFVIVNTKDSSSLGDHWYVIYRDSKSSLECFDSLGVNTEKKHF